MTYEEFLDFCKMDEWQHRENDNYSLQVQFINEFLTPIKYHGIVHRSYYIDKDGDFWSEKNNGRIHKMQINYSVKYPKVKFKYGYETITASLHRIVCETFHEIPLPFGVTEEDWKNTPESVKKCFDHYWEVNHIDHNPENYHPSNLEWVTHTENAIASVNHKNRK